MRELLTLDRFRTLADAYGGVIARWPEEHREAAKQMVFDPEAGDILAQALALDEVLDTWTVAPPALSLRERLTSAAPATKKRPAARGRLWWSSIGIAATLAGATAGTAAVAIVSPVDPSSDSSTSFGDVGTQGKLSHEQNTHSFDRIWHPQSFPRWSAHRRADHAPDERTDDQCGLAADCRRRVAEVGATTVPRGASGCAA